MRILMHKLFAAAVALTLWGVAGSAPADSRPYLTHDQAMRAMSACLALAAKNGWNMSIVVIDRGEDVVASSRMDGALPASYKGAGLKANTALSWAQPTGEVNAILEQAPMFKQFPGILGIPGGAPLFAGKTLIGGVGVAGSSPDNDAKCAAVAAEAI